MRGATAWPSPRAWAPPFGHQPVRGIAPASQGVTEWPDPASYLRHLASHARSDCVAESPCMGPALRPPAVRGIAPVRQGVTEWPDTWRIRVRGHDPPVDDLR